MKNIVIVGAGYGGILTALGLDKKFRGNKDVSITLIDKHDYQLFASNLYEIATADEELTSVSQLKKSIVIPFKEVFKDTTVKLVQAEVSEIDRERCTVKAGIQSIPYDYLVLGIGSETDYFGIPGAKEFSMPLKSLTDALAIRNRLEFAFETHRLDVNKKNLHLVVAGGGYTGVELVAELSHAAQLFAWKNNYPPEKVEISVVEAMNELIPGLSPRMSQDALWKLKNRGVRVLLSSPIAKVEQNSLELSNGERIEYDALIWTTGVRAKPLPFAQEVETDKKGRILTNEFLQCTKDERIFAVGDCACVMNVDGRPAPPTAQDSEAQGFYLQKALPLILQNKKPAPYKGKKHGFVVTLGGETAIFNAFGMYFTGPIAYLARELAHVNYYRHVLGWWKAFWYILYQVRIYRRND